MHRSLFVLGLLCLAGVGCAAERPPEAAYPSGESAPTTAMPAESAEEDEVAEEKAIVNDPAVIAAAEKVKVIQNEHIDCPTELVGLVDIHEPVESVDRALQVLRRKAAKMGAEAVVGVEFHHGEPGEEPTHLSGLAVRCKDLVRGRAYDVLGRVEVRGKMGDEDEAAKELLARATAMHADLLINIGFEHGEGGNEPTKVWGTAIRFKAD